MAVDADIKTKIGGFHRAAMRSATVPALKDEIPSLVCDLHDARERRNKAQHGPCLSIDEAGTAAKIGVRRKPFEWHDHTPASLRNDATFCCDVAQRIAVWISRFTTEDQVPRNSRRSRDDTVQ
jgi:hypothetical protein